MRGLENESLIALTRRLGQLLGSESGTLILSHMQLLGLMSAHLSAAGEPRPAAQAGGAAAARVGVWEKRDGDEDFVRLPLPPEELRCWADVPRIPAKGAGKRVLLLGESVARGYLYDPFVTPASLLQAMLETALGGGEVEVIDLARIDIGAEELIRIVKSVPALEPDAVVLFAGNNWHNIPNIPPQYLVRFAAALREGGYPASRRIFYGELMPAVARAALESVAAVSKAHDFPVLVIVPEFNLREWRNERPLLAPVLKGDHNRRWMIAREAAERALAERQFDEAARLAREMIALDEGTSSVSHTLLAESLLALGDAAGARRGFEMARDAAYGIPVPTSPRCAAVVQEAIRGAAAEHDFMLVDLPRLFAEHLGDELPDRRLFLDYCHLTLDGMKVAMAAAARQLAARLGAGDVSDAELLSVGTGLNPADEAVAHFMAAIHNAHYGQGFEIVRHHCLRALELDESVSGAMLDYLDFQGRRAPHWMCDSYERVCRSESFRRYLAATNPRIVGKVADFLLTDAIVSALLATGVDARGRLDALLKEEHGGLASDVNLLEPFYSAPTYRAREGYSLGPRPAYYEAFDTKSDFFLIRDAAGAVAFKLTCRVPEAAPPGLPVTVKVNDAPVHSLTASGGWATAEFVAPGGVVREGVNRIQIGWPLREVRWEQEMERAASRLERGVIPDALPAFGQVYAFTASAAPDAV